MFWGLIMEPNKRYTQVVEKPFHISQAAMDTSTGDNEPCQVMVVVDGKNFLVCTLQRTKTVQVPLGLYFKTGDSISFLTNGKCNIHLTGYLDPDFEDEEDFEEEEDEEETSDAVPPKNKRKLENGTNEPAANKKLKAEKKGKKAAEDSDSDDDSEDQIQKFLQDEDMETDDNDESFKVNTSGEVDDSDEEDDEEEEEEEDDDDDEEAEEEEEEKPAKKKNNKKATKAEDADTTLETSKEEIDMSKLTKSQKKRLKKKLQQQNKQAQVNGVAKKEAEPQKTEKKKPEKEAKKEGQAEQPAEKREKKQLSGGVHIEDTKVGSGPVAKPGKTVFVYYEGRLKQNNKMFDSCSKGPGFKFRLGSKEVISGWDVGVAGMKVGGKRKIVCPPAMAYGAKGAPPAIPPNSTLQFEVELKNVK